MKSALQSFGGMKRQMEKQMSVSRKSYSHKAIPWSRSVDDPKRLKMSIVGSQKSKKSGMSNGRGKGERRNKRKKGKKVKIEVYTPSSPASGDQQQMEKESIRRSAKAVAHLLSTARQLSSLGLCR